MVHIHLFDWYDVRADKEEDVVVWLVQGAGRPHLFGRMPASGEAMDSDEYSMIMTTASSDDEAETLARHLVSLNLAACVQRLPIKSNYRWEGILCEEEEVLLLIKSRTDRYSDIEACIKGMHSYDVPEILRVPIADGLETYFDWIDVSTVPIDQAE